VSRYGKLLLLLDLADKGSVDSFAKEKIDFFGLPVLGKGHNQIPRVDSFEIILENYQSRW